jgi:hypothetical protein
MTAKNVAPSQHTIPVVLASGKPGAAIFVVSRERVLALADVFRGLHHVHCENVVG